MQTVLRLLPTLCLLALAGCSSDSIKRNVYQSVQTLQQRECLQHPGTKCPPLVDYNQYQQQRQETIDKKTAN